MVKSRKMWFGLIPLLVAGHLTVGSAAVASGGCELGGEGTAASPWLVGSADDFRKIGRGDCSTDSANYYRQTADFSLEDGPSDDGSKDSLPGFINDVFSGVYDGDYYTITLAGVWGDSTDKAVQGVFGSYLDGTVRRLNLAGDYVSTAEWSNPLVWEVREGGVISEVSSSVGVVAEGNAQVLVSGLVGKLMRGSLVEYVAVTGSLEWRPGNPNTTSERYFGGLAVSAGQANGAQGATGSRSVEVRDSYSASTMTWPQANRCKIMAGGLLGLTNQIGGDIFVVRSYSASRPATGDIATVCPGNNWNPFGGLFGRVDDPRRFDGVGQTSRIYPVSTFWSTDVVPAPESGTVTVTAVGGLQSPSFFSHYADRLPLAAGLSSTLLRDITTYQSFGQTSQPLPDGEAELPVASSTPISYASDNLYEDKSAAIRQQPESFRWAIESSATPFIASQYATPAFGFQDGPNFLSRTLFGDTTIERGESRIASGATGYPSLGRVWEICEDTNDGFPVLVWEGYCGDGESGAVSEGPDSETAETVISVGLETDQEQQLAATGVNPLHTTALALLAGGLLSIGWLMTLARRPRVAEFR